MYDQTARTALERMNMRPVAIASRFSHALVADMQTLATANQKTEQEKFEVRKAELCAAYGVQQDANSTAKPYAFGGGVAIIPISGTLINRFSHSFGYVTGYNYLTRAVAAAGQDPDVKAIVFDVNSYGGEAAGCFECARDMRALAGGKPTLAVIDSNCYSAGYATASAASKIVAIPSGGAGSIGVVAMHVSMEKLLEKWGIAVTFIHSGEHKVDGNPFEDLPEDVKEEIQADVDKSRAQFAELISEHRGLDKKKIMDTEARCYRAEDALALGLIDAIATPSAAVQGFLRELSGSNPQLSHQENPMSDDTKPGAANQATEQDAAKLQAEARQAERTRMAGIMSCEEAKKRQKLAQHIATNTSLSIEEAKGMLAASPEEASPAAAAGNPFRQSMDAGQHPNIGADTQGADADEDPSRANTQRILAAQSMATGRKLPAKH